MLRPQDTATRERRSLDGLWRFAISVMAAYPINEDRLRHMLREIAELRATRGSDETPPRDDDAD